MEAVLPNGLAEEVLEEVVHGGSLADLMSRKRQERRRFQEDGRLATVALIDTDLLLLQVCRS